LALILSIILGLILALLAGTAAIQANGTGRHVPFQPSIIIDAGHGGFDGGAVGRDGTVEKNINLAIARKLRDLCELNGISTIMVRDDDHDVADHNLKSIRSKKVSDIHNRLALTVQNPDAIFISIHQNQFPQNKYWGAQVFYGPKNECSQLLAQSIQHNFRVRLTPDNQREIKIAEKNLYILYNTKSPAVLVECGFLSHAQECAMLQDDEYQQQVAFVILCSLLEFEKPKMSLQTGLAEND
ncbi:MAG: N-acetylmuramoyl-L-alanine amidase, partial [Oscillospiraceae bacterium]